MTKFKNFIFFNILLLLLVSCGVLKDGMVNQKKNGTDEFLVEKKSPLIMPPDFNELPIPNQKNNTTDNTDNKENSFKKLITKGDVEIDSENNNSANKNIEETLLDKIKNN
jgi:hypothetical protein